MNSSTTDQTLPTGQQRIDVRGPRFSAALTFVVLSVAFLWQAQALLAVQVAVFAVAAIAGLRFSPYGNLFRVLKRCLDLGPPGKTEAESGPRFSQLMGLIFSGTGLVAVLSGATSLGWALVLIVCVLSGLLATTGLCVGCEMYALAQRLGRTPERPAVGGR